MLKASVFIPWLKKHEGDAYVYGAAPGQKITVALLKVLDSRWGVNGQWPAGLSENYFHLNGDYTRGRCGKWLGKWGSDCSGLIKTGRKELTGVWKDVSAQGTYDQCSKRGTIDTIPLIPGCAVYMYSDSKKRMSHVGTYIGNGKVLEARGVDYGIVITKLSERKWTHWGLLDWLDYDLHQENGAAKVGGSGDAGDASTRKPGDQIEVYKQTIQKHVQFTDPEGIWAVVEMHPYHAEWLRKWAESYKS